MKKLNVGNHSTAPNIMLPTSVHVPALHRVVAMLGTVDQSEQAAIPLATFSNTSCAVIAPSVSSSALWLLRYEWFITMRALLCKGAALFHRS